MVSCLLHCAIAYLVNISLKLLDVLDDFDFALARKSDPGVSLVRDAIKLAKATLEFPGEFLTEKCLPRT